MPWYFPWSESLKKRACRYLLQYYLGNFLKEKLTLDQLSVDLYNGTGLIKDVHLDVWTLNEALENFSVPFEIVDGFIGSISMSIPWSALVNDNTILEISGLELTVQPKQRPEKGTGIMIDSMFSSMTTSMQLAQECLKQEGGDSDQQQSSQPFEGLEMFAQTIESVLTKVKVSIKDSIFRLEHTLPDTKMGIALEVKVSRIDYFDDLAKDDGSPVDKSLPSTRSVYEPAAKTHKNFHLMGVTLFTDQFTETDRTISSRSTSFYSTSQGSPKTAESLSPPLSPPAEATPNPLLQQMGSSDSPKSLRIPVIQSEPIKMAVCHGKQELKLKIKQSEELPGPKLEVECQFGSMLAHLAPSQLHLLTELFSSMVSPTGSNGDGNLHSLNKPMQPDDYFKVEHELQKQLHDVRIAEHMATKHYQADDITLTTQPVSVDSDDEMYYDLVTSQGAVSTMDSSFSSTLTSKSSSTQASMRHRYGTVYYQQTADSPFQATLPKAALQQQQQVRTQQPKAKTKTRTHHKDPLHRLLDDPTAEVTKYKVKLSFFSLVVLHEDPVVTPTSDNSDASQSEVERLKAVSEAYFTHACSVSTMGHDLEALRGMFAEVCPYDHLQLLGKPLNVDLTEKLASIGSLTGEVSIGLFDFVECLFDRRAATSSILGFSLPIDNVLPTYTELLTFVHDIAEATPHMFSSMHAGSAPCIKVQIQSIQKSSSGSRRGPTEPKTQVHIELGHCRSEIDITLMDRINALLNPHPMFSTADSGANRQFKSHNPSLYLSQQACFRQVIDEGPSASDSKTDIRVTSPLAVLTLKFPIPDLRSGQGVDRRPWWRKSLRKESLILELTEADFQTSICSSNTGSKYEFTCKDIHGLFQEIPQDPPVSFVRVSHGNDNGNLMTGGKEEGFDWPRIVISTFPQVHSELEDDCEESEDSLPQDSLNGACQFAKTEPSPFSAKKAMYNNEEIVMPGDKDEINDFQEKSATNTQLLIDISLPNVSGFIPNKHFFEVIYNRFNNDLLLWEPLAPAPLTTQDGLNAGLMLGGWDLNMDIQMMQQDSNREMFQLCRSGLQYDSSSDSDDGCGQYYSIKDYKLRQRRKRRMEQAHLQSKACVNFTIGKGSLVLCAPLLDDLGKVSEEFEGRVQLDLSEGNFTLVVAHNGDPEVQLLCVTANQVAVFHSGKEAKIQQPFSSVERLDRLYHSSLEPTFYLSEPGVHTKLSGKVGLGADSIDQLAVALRIKMDTFRNVKEFLVALGIRGTTLYHRTLPSKQTWLTQVMNFLTVDDYPILGYTMPTVLTELHIHFTGCAVDYRPRYLPARAMLTVENFSISSNIVADSATSLLRFMVDDASLFISKHCNAESVDLKKNYVCVVDIGLFELTLRSSDGKDPKYPKMDLWASNNIVHIHTCADSCHLLQDLIKYLASDADLERLDDDEDEDGDEADGESTLTGREEHMLSDSPKLRQSHMEEVHHMMEDAMQESVTDSQHSALSCDDLDSNMAGGAEIFFFPDETQQQHAVAVETTASPLPDVMTDSCYQKMAGSGTSNDTDHYSEDEEFCIIDDPGLGIAPRGSEPSIRVLTDEPLVIHENFFSTPLTKADQLKAPDSFPSPEYKYTLKDMSLVWNMYGGSDFSRRSDDEEMKKSDAFEVHYTTRGTEIYKSVHSSHKGKQLSWQVCGGPGRNLDTHMELHLLKVSMQHEVYPENTPQASRQILIINDIEIRDRLSTSKINKFLYQYSSESMPRRSHANMLQVKAIHRRPDPALPAQECSLKISLHPIRLNVDQDSLFFMGKFFSEVSGEEKEIGSKSKDTAKPYTPPPVMTVGGQVTMPEPDPQELLIMFDTMTSSSEPAVDEEDEEALGRSGSDGTQSVTSEGAASTVTSQPQPVYFKRFIFSPDVLIRIDYHGKHVDMQQGTLAGLIVGLAQLNCSELRLKRLDHRHGLLGVDRLAMYAAREWISDIKNHQLPSILGGVGPLHSFVQLYQGIRDLFWLPVEQYRKDGRIVRGLQRGAQSFTMSTAAAALELTNRMVQAVQFIAEITYDMVSPGPSVRKRKRHKLYRRIAQPSDLREGMTNAYIVVREGITGTAQDIYKAATEEHHHKGVSGAVGGVLRQIPPTVIHPVILATEATSEVLGGMRNQLLPDARKEQEEKWKQQC